MFVERNSPHIHSGSSTMMSMWHVIIALLPATACALWLFGLPAARVLAVSLAVCIASEWAIARFMLGRVNRASLVAAAVTGLLLALNLPPSLPWWTAAIGAVVAIGIGKMAFGGLGSNIFNPALVGRIFLLVSFPALMTVWQLPGSGFEADASTGPTVLQALKYGFLDADSISYPDLLLGRQGGSMGETAALALLLGFAYLLAMRVITWHIPVVIIATVAVMDLALGVPVGIDVLSGGLMLGAIFMATDYATSPMTTLGKVVYAIGIGLVTVVIRRWGAYPEGMSFAIVIFNGFTPLINKYCSPRRFGARAGKGVAA